MESISSDKLAGLCLPVTPSPLPSRDCPSFPEEFLKLPRPTDQRGIRALRRPRRQGAPRRCRRDGGLSPPRAVHSFSLELSPPPLMFPFSFDGANMDPLEMG